MLRALWVLTLLLPSPQRASADDLVLNQFPQPIRTVVYELPGIPPDVGAGLAARLRSYLGGAEVIDGQAASDAELRAKVQGPWILISLLSNESRLLKLAAAPLPFRLEDDTFHWGELAAPAREIRAAFMGKNPFGNAPCMVQAVGIGQDLSVSVNGWNSYVIYRGRELAARGVYDTQFADRDSVSAADARADVEEFFATLERVHPDVFSRLGQEGVKRMRAATRDGVAALADARGRVSVEKLAWLLLHAGGSLRDGHTGVMWRVEPRQQVTAGKRFPPFLLAAEDGRFRITAAVKPEIVGAELVAIERTPAADFFSPVLDRCSGETPIFRAKLLESGQAFWWWASNLFGAATVRLQVRVGGGAVAEHSVETLDFAAYSRLRAPAGPRRAAGVQMFDSGKIAHWVYPAFVTGDAEKAKIENVLRQVREAGAEDLIIDLRGNGGGNSEMGDYIFRRIWREPVEQVSEQRMKVSPEAVAVLRKYMPWLPPAVWKLFDANQGKVLSSRDPALKQLAAEVEKARPADPPPAAKYSGRLWLMVDNATFSSANLFAAAFRDYGMGKIIGYETGEPPASFGDCPSFQLKHSRIPCRVSSKQFFPPKPRPGDEERGIVPDIPLDPQSLARWRSEPDPELAFLLDLIRRRR